MSYPQHFKVVEDGKIQVLVTNNGANYQYVAQDGVIYTVATLEDVKSYVGGDFLPVDNAEYEETMVGWRAKSAGDAVTEMGSALSAAGLSELKGGTIDEAGNSPEANSIGGEAAPDADTQSPPPEDAAA